MAPRLQNYRTAGIFRRGGSRNMKKQVGIFLLLLSPLASHADSQQSFTDSASSQANFSQSAMDELEAHPFRLYGGAATGYGNVSGQDYTDAPDGPQVLLSADLSFQNTRWVFEGGAGWMYSRLDGTENGSGISIRTRSGFADASARYRLTQHWQIGPAYNLDFGADTRFGPTIGNSTDLSLVGVRADYEFALGHAPFRIVAEGMTGVGLGDRNFELFTLGFKIGLPFGNGDRSQETHEEPIRVSSAAPYVPPVEIRIVLDPKKVFFSTNSSEIKPEVLRALRDIGSYLAENEDQWGRVELSGHADQRGKADYNMELSKRRSVSVLNVFSDEGVKDDKIGIEYFGFSQPADPHNNPQAWAVNRRVELVFLNVKNPEDLQKKIAELSHYELSGEQHHE
jgi:outer membrane protein OmpA-like peptidoglycan-associated protein